MTTSQVEQGTMVLRHWDRARGLIETPQVFQSLDDLYALCLAVDAPSVIDRIIIRGQDASGHPQVVTFVFQSITVSSHTGV